MTNKEFVAAVKAQTSDAAIEGTIECLTKPPGRKPSEELVRLSQWYNMIDDEGRRMVASALREAAELAAFEFFCLLDGVSVIEDSPDKGELEVHLVKGADRIRMNDPRGEELHNVFNALCRIVGQAAKPIPQLSPYDSGEAQELRSKLVSGDNL